MLKLYDNVLPVAQLLKIKESILDLYHSNKLLNEHTAGGYVEQCFGLNNIPATLENIDGMKERVEKDYGSHYEFTHAFSRIYFNDATLRIHVDRAGLDLTGSLKVFDNLDEPWPLYFSNKIYDGDEWDHNTPCEEFLDSYESLIVNPNQMAVCIGTKTPHWRDRLVCKPGQYSIHVFYHWKNNHYES